jgi:hypothetical protein
LRELFVAASRAARRHWLFAILFSGGVVLRVLTQVAYRPALLYIDSDRYLRGLSALDPLGYRALLWPLQRFGGLAGAAAVQHLLGLAMAFALYVVLRRHGMWRWAAAVATMPVLLDAYQIELEQTIMPDVLFESLIVAGLAMLLWRHAPAAWMLIVASLMFGAAVDVRQVGEVLIIPALLFALLSAVGWRQRLTHGMLTVISFSIPVIAYMTVQYAVAGHFSMTQRNAYIFYGRTAAAADCATLRIPADERALCPSREAVDALGIDGLVGDPAGPLQRYRPPPGMSIEAMADRFEWTVVTQQPMAVVGAIDGDFLKLFALTREQSPGDTPISRWQFQATYPTYPPVITLKYVASVEPGGGAPAVIKPLAALLRGYQLHGGYAPGPLLALASIAGLAGICSLGGPRGMHSARARGSALVMTTAFSVLLVSDSFEFSWRYQLPAVVLLPSAGVLGLAAITARLRFEIAAWQEVSP